MKSPWSRFHGVDALRSFLRKIPHWQTFMSEDIRKKHAYSTYLSLEIAGNRIKEGSINANKGIFSGEPSNEHFANEIYKKEIMALDHLTLVFNKWIRVEKL